MSLRSTPWWSLVLALLVMLVPRGARAQDQPPAAAPVAAPKPPAPPMTLGPESWAGQLEILEKWLVTRNAASTRCTERCYTLERLVLSGSVEAGSLDFELEGGVLADGPVAVPLFGPPNKVRLHHVLEDGRPGSVGFETDHYYVFTRARRFVVKGTLALHGDLALTVSGPLNSLEANLSTGRVVEGAHLSGLAQTTIHFDAAKGDTVKSEPTVFQLSRAVRIGREMNFEYHLVMRSGKDLGVARLPLRYGEKVLDVTGSSGWEMDGGDLVLPTAGNVAEMTITGTLPALGTFAPDPRSAYEWWLIESDAEHRMAVAGDARQVDSSQSPIARAQPTSRLFLVQKGEHIDVSVQALVSTEVLAAVVRNHSRTVVLTTRGDLVADDTLSYENNGIDYLMLSPQGRAIYLSTDGRAERIMQQGGTAEGNDVLVPLLVGSHTVHSQALSGTNLAAFFGTLDLPVPTYPLTASHVGVRVGLPSNVHAVAILGGDHADWFLTWRDGAAVAVGMFAAWLAFRTLTRRALGAFALVGLWFVAPPLYVLALGVFVAAAGVWLLGRLLPRKHFFVVAAALACGCGLAFAILAAASTSLRQSSAGAQDHQASGVVDTPKAAADKSVDGRFGQVNERSVAQKGLADVEQRAGNGYAAAQVAGAGVVQGVTPVALALPSYDHDVYATRELVTKDRAFNLQVVYVTTMALLPLAGAWLLSIVLLVASHRAAIVALWRRVRARVSRGPAPHVPPQPGTGPTPIV